MRDRAILSIILPSYNESENLGEMIHRTEASLENVGRNMFEILVVDDNSPDGSATVGRRLCEIYGNVRVINRPKRLGLTSAILEGMKAARGDFLVVMDADLQHPPEALPMLFDEIGSCCDLVVMSRYLGNGATEDWGVTRRSISKIAIFLTHLASPKTKPLTDPISGFFMVKACAIDGVELKPDGFKILPEILSKGRLAAIKEIAYTFSERKKGNSKLGLGEAVRYMAYLVELTLTARHQRNQTAYPSLNNNR